MRKEIERHFQDLFEGLPVMQVLTSFPEGIPIVADCNRHFVETLGYVRSEVLERPLAHFYSSSSQQKLQAGGGYTRSLHGDFMVEERELVTKNGRIIPTLLRAVPIQNQQGDVTGTQAVFIDISDRKRIEQQLNYQTLLLDNMTDAVIGTDTNYVITSWNKAAEQMYGWTAEEAIGQMMPALLRTDFLDGSSREDMLGVLQQAGSWKGELAQWHRNDRMLHVLAAVSLLFNVDGRFLGVVTVNHDITEQKMAKAALQESETRFRSLIEAATVGVLIVAQDGRIYLVNRKIEEMFGYTRQELARQPLEMLLPARFRQYHEALRQDYLASPSVRAMGIGRELFGRRQNGEEFPIEVGLNFIEEGGKLFGLAYVTDITVRRQNEAMVLASLQEKEVLLQEIHHRVKNNLQIVSSLLDLQTLYREDSVSREILQDSRQRVQTMALIHEKLYRSSNLKKVNFSEYMNDLLVYLWQSLAGKTRNVQLVTDIAPLALDVETAVPCGLILNELISNAVKHAFPNEQPGQLNISLSSYESGQQAILSVSDNGVGLPPDLDWRQGQSLGLTIVQTLVQQLGGQMAVETAVGTTFKITFKWRKTL